MKAARARLAALAARPTLLAQGVAALGALGTMAAVTRGLTSDSYGVYAAVFATYAFGNALVATTIGTRVMEAVSTGRATRVEVVVRRDLLPVGLCVLAAGGTALGIGATDAEASWAAAGMFGFILAEVAYSYVLGRRRYWLYLGIVCVRTLVWVGATLAVVLLLPEHDRLSGALAASLLGTLIPAAYVAVRVGVGAGSAAAPGHRAMISGVGVANLALWLLASADRVILAHFALSAVATYAALYGILDRVFRGIANADVQLRLPLSFAGGVEGEGAAAAPRASMAGPLLLGAVSAVAGPLIVAAASGGKYHPPLAMSIVLSAAMVAMLTAVPRFVTLIAAGRAGSAAKVAVLAAAVNIGGNLLLAPRFGAGAAAALTLVGYLVWLLGVTLLIRRVEGAAPPVPLAQPAAAGPRDAAEGLLEAQL